MVSKTIVVIESGGSNNNSKRTTAGGSSTSKKQNYWIIGNQAAFENLLRQYQTDTFIEESPYKCEISNYTSLIDGGIYTLGDSFSSSVELQELYSSDASGGTSSTTRSNHEKTKKISFSSN